MAVISTLLLITATPVVAYGAVSPDFLNGVPEPKQTNRENVKDGLVEIQTGFASDDKFYQVRECNGFLISNAEGRVYIVTTAHGVSVSKSDREQSDAGDNASVSVRVLVRGDVASELTEVTFSKKQDFCVFEASDVVKTKGTVVLKGAGETESGESVYAMGFPAKKADGSPLQYETQDVETHEGETIGISTLDGVPFVQHTCIIDKSMDGSVLTDKNGFVVGMNNTARGDGNQYYALSIEEIEKVLDNYGIPYATEQTDTAYAQLYARCKKGIRQSNQSRYKAETRMLLEAELENSKIVLQESPHDLEKLTEADALLEKAQKQLKTKIPKSLWIIILLGLIIVVLAIRFVKLYLWRRKHEDELETFEQAPVKKRRKKSGKNTAEQPDEFIDVNEPEPTIVGTKEMPPKTETELIVPAKKMTMYWERMDWRVPVDKSEFTIGKKKELVDFAIEDNRMISRRHAIINKTRRGYVVIDLKSTNGTYVNEQPVPEGGSILHDGDLLRLADESFIVEIK